MSCIPGIIIDDNLTSVQLRQQPATKTSDDCSGGRLSKAYDVTIQRCRKSHT